MLTATVSGSFHRHMEDITTAVYELASHSVHVLSPSNPRVVAAQGKFLFVASDPIRSVRLVQDRHLESICASNFLWLVCPDGYVGQSASMEIGYAVSQGVPILSTRAPLDITLRQYVKSVPSLAAAVRMISVSPKKRVIRGILIDPRASLEKAHLILDRVGTALTHVHDMDDPAGRVHSDLAELQENLRLPTFMQ